MTIPAECLTKEQTKGRDLKFYWGFDTTPIYRVTEQLIENIPSYYRAQE